MSYYNPLNSQAVAVIKHKPVVLVVYSYNWQSYAGSLLCSSASQPYSIHAVLAVGYAPDRIIFKNSWGTSWGVNGYGYVNMNCLNIISMHYLVDNSPPSSPSTKF